MRRLVLLCALLVGGCDLLSPSQTIEIIQDTQPTEVTPGGGSSGSSAITGLRAERAACNADGDCSSFRLFWSGGEAPFSSVATRTDGLTHTQDLSGPGAELVDPGPPGEGGGVWSVTLNGAGPVTVALDS